jgi:hypothetical protein
MKPESPSQMWVERQLKNGGVLAPMKESAHGLGFGAALRITLAVVSMTAAGRNPR